MALDDQQVSEQIKQMVAFIESEAREKVEEIRAKAEEEFNIEKARLVQEETIKINQQLERRAKQVETQQKIEYSNKLNVARLEVLKAQEEALKSVTEQATKDISDITKDKAKYKTLLQDLLTQCLCQLLEPEATVRVRKQDISLIKEVINGAKKAVKDKTGIDVKLTVDEEHCLDEECGGGVEVAVTDRIRVTNTLKRRLELAVQQLMPALRLHLFGEQGTRAFFN
ncbi:uncharacterized protein MONBRDRAFT_37555 [Monosiga brevicollis MX1]|uniref:V-type proton ATPase subunit E n=1 Tax=Monosiga brevicollis TaxID=81824 RepID=A9V2H6_MONBE|nr:uncharacterized protein MONBRDRAFT_37555 [Monosiga brevicollis MX1]EDQ88258.1 predicted protein [Monosiga brevicollis MX1]|eukprot:XP_001746851.1 hypothetical protein [Monosiga brevicollis MX1]